MRPLIFFDGPFDHSNDLPFKVNHRRFHRLPFSKCECRPNFHIHPDDSDEIMSNLFKADGVLGLVFVIVDDALLLARDFRIVSRSFDGTQRNMPTRSLLEMYGLPTARNVSK